MKKVEKSLTFNPWTGQTERIKKNIKKKKTQSDFIREAVEEKLNREDK